MLSRHLLEAARLLPPSTSASGASEMAAVGAEDAAMGTARQEAAGGGLEVMLLLLQALHFHSSWQLGTFKVYVRILLDVLLEPSICQHADSRAAALHAVHSTMLALAYRTYDLLREAVVRESSGDGLLDALLEEWELHQAPPADVTAFCGDPQRLLPASAWRPLPRLGQGAMTAWASPADSEARRTICCFLLLRRLLSDLMRYSARAATSAVEAAGTLESTPWVASSQEASPLQVEEDTACGLREGLSMDVGPWQRLLCGVALPSGRCTRYLLLHDYWLVLVQPDLAAPGWAVVKTLRPIWQVQPLVDRGDPRTLQLVLHAQSDVRASCSEASRLQAAGGYIVMSLDFEDVRHAHEAIVHLQARRRDLRGQLMRKAVVFVQACCAQPPPGPEGAEDGAAGTSDGCATSTSTVDTEAVGTTAAHGPEHMSTPQLAVVPGPPLPSCGARAHVPLEPAGPPWG